MFVAELQTTYRSDRSVNNDRTSLFGDGARFQREPLFGGRTAGNMTQCRSVSRTGARTTRSVGLTTDSCADRAALSSTSLPGPTDSVSRSCPIQIDSALRSQKRQIHLVDVDRPLHRSAPLRSAAPWTGWSVIDSTSCTVLGPRHASRSREVGWTERK